MPCRLQMALSEGKSSLAGSLWVGEAPNFAHKPTSRDCPVPSRVDAESLVKARAQFAWGSSSPERAARDCAVGGWAMGVCVGGLGGLRRLPDIVWFDELQDAGACGHIGWLHVGGSAPGASAQGGSSIVVEESAHDIRWPHPLGTSKSGFAA